MHEEYERTRILVLAITGQQKLMETVPSIRESIRLRDSIIMPLLVIQQFALTEMERQTSSNEPSESGWTPELPQAHHPHDVRHCERKPQRGVSISVKLRS